MNIAMEDHKDRRHNYDFSPIRASEAIKLHRDRLISFALKFTDILQLAAPLFGARGVSYLLSRNLQTLDACPSGRCHQNGDRWMHVITRIF